MSLILKVDNVMAMHAGAERVRLIYPYFCKEHGLTEEWGRVGLWLLKAAFPASELDDMEIVDVMRGSSVSGRRTLLHGNEELLFMQAYKVIHDEWVRLKPQYGL